jgi:hypothetical protein
MTILDTITRLSHTFGTADYVKAGGGNTSCKDERTLWVKPSGTTLAGLKPETFVAMDRASLAKLYAAETPAEPAAREELVKDYDGGGGEAGDAGARVGGGAAARFDFGAVCGAHPSGGGQWPDVRGGRTCGGGAAFS